MRCPGFPSVQGLSSTMFDTLVPHSQPHTETPFTNAVFEVLSLSLFLLPAVIGAIHSAKPKVSTVFFGGPRHHALIKKMPDTCLSPLRVCEIEHGKGFCLCCCTKKLKKRNCLKAIFGAIFAITHNATKTSKRKKKWKRQKTGWLRISTKPQPGIFVYAWRSHPPISLHFLQRQFLTSYLCSSGWLEDWNQQRVIGGCSPDFILVFTFSRLRSSKLAIRQTSHFLFDHQPYTGQSVSTLQPGRNQPRREDLSLHSFSTWVYLTAFPQAKAFAHCFREMLKLEVRTPLSIWPSDSGQSLLTSHLRT